MLLSLVLQVNDCMLNCVICNTELSHRPQLVEEHTRGKKHLKNCEMVVSESSTTENYDDCYDDVLVVEN